MRENKYFVALKLLNGVGVKSIQPIVLTFRGTEACVPLRLTAIAANPDMPVLVWVLSDKRVAPRGYFEIKIDEARIDWLRQRIELLRPDGAGQPGRQRGGRQRVRRPSTRARRRSRAPGLRRTAQINLTTLLMAMTPPAYVQQLISMGLASDPLMLPLLDEVHPDARRREGDGRHRRRSSTATSASTGSSTRSRLMTSPG